MIWIPILLSSAMFFRSCSQGNQLGIRRLHIWKRDMRLEGPQPGPVSVGKREKCFWEFWTSDRPYSGHWTGWGHVVKLSFQAPPTINTYFAHLRSLTLNYHPCYNWLEIKSVRFFFWVKSLYWLRFLKVHTLYCLKALLCH